MLFDCVKKFDSTIRDLKQFKQLILDYLKEQNVLDSQTRNEKFTEWLLNYRDPYQALRSKKVWLNNWEKCETWSFFDVPNETKLNPPTASHIDTTLESHFLQGTALLSHCQATAKQCILRHAKLEGQNLLTQFLDPPDLKGDIAKVINVRVSGKCVE